MPNKISDSDWYAFLDKLDEEDKAGDTERKVAKVKTDAANAYKRPDIARDINPTKDDVAQGLLTGVKKGFADMGGGTGNAAGTGAQLGADYQSIKDDPSLLNILKTGGKWILPELANATGIQFTPLGAPVKEAIKRAVMPEYAQGHDEQEAKDIEQMTPAGGGAAIAEVAPQALMAMGSLKGPLETNAIPLKDRLSMAKDNFFSGGGNGKFSLMDRALKASDALKGIIDPGEGAPNSYGAFGIKPDEVPPMPFDENAVNPEQNVSNADIVSQRPDYTADADPDTVFADRREYNLQSKGIPPGPSKPPVPPDDGFRHVPGAAFQASPRQEIPMGPETEGPVFDPRQQDVFSMANQLEQELNARRGLANAATKVISPKERMARYAANDINIPHDTIASDLMPRSDLVPLPGYGKSKSTMNMRPPVEPPNEPPSGGKGPSNQGNDMVPQWVRDLQGPQESPTFGDKGRPDDEQNLLWLESQLHANKLDKAEKMLRDRFGDEYVDYLIKNMDFEK